MDYYGQNGTIPWNMQMPKIYDDGVIAVHGIEGAKAVNVKAGSAVILPDDCEKIMYFIQADSFGIKTITPYPYGDPIGSQTQQQAPTQNQTQKTEETPIYVQQKEFDELKKSVDKLVEQLGGMDK